MILHILEPLLNRRAKLRDIAMHHWVQSRPRQDSHSPCVIQQSDRNGDDYLLDGSIDLSGSSRENLSGSLPESDNSSSFCNSLPEKEGGRPSVPSVSSCSPNLDVIGFSPSARSKVVTGDYIPLCDDDMDGYRLRLSGHVTFKERDEDCDGIADDGLDDSLCSTSVLPREMSLSLDSGCESRNHNHKFSSDVDRSVVSPPLLDGKETLTAAAETRLPVSFSADSLELLADGDCSGSSAGPENSASGHLSSGVITDVGNVADDNDEDDDCETENSCGDRYDFADIDAVLDHVISDIDKPGNDVDDGSQVSYDSLEDAV